MLRLAEALDHFKPGLGDVATVLAFTGLRWEEAVAVPVENVDLDGQWITVDRTASESGGRRDVRADLKTRAAERVAAIPDIAMPAVRRLAGAARRRARTERGQDVRPAHQRGTRRLPRLRHVAPVSGPRRTGTPPRTGTGR